MNPHIVYDYIIVGAGAAGLHLALAILTDPYFENQSVLIIDKETKSINDKTWCFWECGEGKWDRIISQEWTLGAFYSVSNRQLLQLQPYRYKMLESLKFYEYAKKELSQCDRMDWIHEEVMEIEEGEIKKVKVSQNQYLGREVFDSRYDFSFLEIKDKYAKILQHFKGWEIETAESQFDPREFIMMDFRVKWPESTSFIYVLPFSNNRALIECTFFSPQLVQDEVYDSMLRSYMSNILKIKEYRISRTEKGVIPMTDFPFQQSHRPGITKIGTAGAWVKPSSGYSFKNCEKMSRKLIENIKNGNSRNQGLLKWRYRKYDSILLDILQSKNHLGEKIFTELYTRNPIQRIFRFLDEESNWVEDLRLISSLSAGPFLQSAWNLIKR